VNIDQTTTEMGRDWINLAVVLTWGLFFITILARLALAFSIKDKLRVLYPNIWKNVERERDKLFPNLNTRPRIKALNRVIYKTPREITNKKLLKDFLVYKGLWYVQGVMCLLAVFTALYASRGH
jgi:hypothetical protein